MQILANIACMMIIAGLAILIAPFYAIWEGYQAVKRYLNDND